MARLQPHHAYHRPLRREQLDLVALYAAVDCSAQLPEPDEPFLVNVEHHETHLVGVGRQRDLRGFRVCALLDAYHISPGGVVYLVAERRELLDHLPHHGLLEAAGAVYS